jgi:GNAT superfamily N-acetyltransferase
MRIRRAVAADANAACQVLRASITELCVADHQNAPEVVAAWLANKTPQNIASWITDPTSIILVADDEGTICAVGGLTHAGEIALNYVASAARFCGVSKAMITALEEEAQGLGLTTVTLSSTLTARQFYKAAGFIENGDSSMKHGLPNFPMMKALR